MTVYVNNFRFVYRGMRRCYLLADTDDELHAMADRIGVPMAWHQWVGSDGSHYVIARSMRQLAIQYGAVPISCRQAAMMVANRRKTGALAEPNPTVVRSNP